MIVEWCVGVAMFTAAGLLYKKKALPISEWDRFGVVCRALPEDLWRQFCEKADGSERALLEQARAEQTGVNSSQALAEFLSPLVGVNSTRVADPDRSFRDFLDTHSNRVFGALEKQLKAWTHCWVQLDGKSRAAILLMTIPPELSAEVFKILGPEEVQSITLAIARLPHIHSGVRHLVIRHFLGEEKPDAQLESKLTALAARDPQLLASMLRSL